MYCVCCAISADLRFAIDAEGAFLSFELPLCSNTTITQYETARLRYNAAGHYISFVEDYFKFYYKISLPV